MKAFAANDAGASKTNAELRTMEGSGMSTSLARAFAGAGSFLAAIAVAGGSSLAFAQGAPPDSAAAPAPGAVEFQPAEGALPVSGPQPPPPGTQAPPPRADDPRAANAGGPPSGVLVPSSPDKPPPFDPTALSPSGETQGALQPGADLQKPPPPPGANGYAPSLAPPPGVPTDSRLEVAVENPSLMKLGPKDTFAILRTSYGNMTVKLFPQYAPITVRNFIDLAKGAREWTEVRTGRKVQRAFYNGLIFHRVIPGFIAQTGCPFGNGRGGPGYAIKNETHPALRHSRAGVVSMANEMEKGQPKPDSAGSQFFITLAPHPEFDGKFTVFGQVVQGMDTLDKIGNAKTGPTDRPVRRILLQSVEIVEK